MKLFVEIPNEENLYLGEVKGNEQTFADRYLDRLCEKYRNNSFTFFTQEDFSKPIVTRFTLSIWCLQDV